MKVGVPKEVKNHEYRVAITPVGVHELTQHGHEVFVEKSAGTGSQIADEEYLAAGAKILDSADEVWGAAEMVLKVKEPVAEEYHRLREGLTLFTYLHLAADQPLTEELVARIHRHRLRDRAAGLGRAAAALPDVRGRGLPRPAGRRALADEGPGRPRGAHGRRRRRREREGRHHRRGVSGQNAANIALGMGADVTLLDTDLDKLRMSFWRYDNRVHGLASSKLPSSSRSPRPTWSSARS